MSGDRCHCHLKFIVCRGVSIAFKVKHVVFILKRTLVMAEKISLIGLKAAREERGFTQEVLSELACVSERTIQRIEKGQSTSFSTANAIANALDIDNIESLRHMPEDGRLGDVEEFDDVEGNYTAAPCRVQKIIKTLIVVVVSITAVVVSFGVYRALGEVEKDFAELHYQRAERNIGKIISQAEYDMASSSRFSAGGVINDNRTLYSVVKYNVEYKQSGILAKYIQKHNKFSLDGCLSEVENWEITRYSTLNDIKALAKSMQESCPRLAGLTVMDDTFPKP